jgi:hypothetical protein
MSYNNPNPVTKSSHSISDLSRDISTSQIVAFIQTNFPNNAARTILNMEKKDNVVSTTTTERLRPLSIAECLQLWYISKNAKCRPSINTFTAIPKLTEIGYSVGVDEKGVTLSRDTFVETVPVVSGLVQLSNKSPALVTELGEKFDIFPHAEGLASLAVVLGSLTHVQNGEVKVLAVDEVSFIAAGLSGVFSREKFLQNQAMLAFNMTLLLNKYARAKINPDSGVRPTFHGTVYTGIVYECLFLSVQEDHTNRVAPSDRQIKNLTLYINAMAKKDKQLDLTGKIIDQSLTIRHETLSFMPAPCLFPNAIGQKKLTWVKDSPQSLSLAMHILQKCRGVRGSDDNELSAMSRMAYLGLILSASIATVMYLVTNLKRFLDDSVHIFIIHDNDGKQVAATIHALKIVYGETRPVSVVCHRKPDLKKLFETRAVDKDKTETYVKGTNIRIIDDTNPNMYLARDPSPNELVYDARHLTVGNWESEPKHFDYEKNVEAAHSSRLHEWGTLLKGRKVIGRLPFCLYQRQLFNPANKEESVCFRFKRELNAAHARLFGKGAYGSGVISGVELHNLVGWEYSGFDPAGESWWYSLDEWNNMLLASQICNMARIQWAYTRRSPCQRLMAKALKYPIIPKEYLPKVSVLSVLFDHDKYEIENIGEMTDDEFGALCANLTPEEIAILSVRREQATVPAGETGNVAGAHGGDDNSLFDAPPLSDAVPDNIAAMPI